MPSATRLCCVTVLLLLMCGCQSFSTPRIQPVAATCLPPPGAVGVVHAIRRAQLDPAHAQRIITITDDGDNAVIALRACQAYAKKVSMRK